MRRVFETLSGMAKISKNEIENRIDMARGLTPCDLVLKNAKWLDVFSGRWLEGDIAIHGGTIIGVGLKYRSHRKVLGLAEMMNYPGLLNKDPDVIEKIYEFQEGHIDGHAPLLRGK